MDHSAVYKPLFAGTNVDKVRIPPLIVLHATNVTHNATTISVLKSVIKIRFRGNRKFIYTMTTEDY